MRAMTDDKLRAAEESAEIVILLKELRDRGPEWIERLLKTMREHPPLHELADAVERWLLSPEEKQ